jgi:type I restriction enzyme S subunit
LVPTEAQIAHADSRQYESADRLLKRILERRYSEWASGGLGKMKSKGDVLKYKDPVRPETGNLPSLPEGWCLASLEQLTSGVRTICYGILMPKENVPDGVPYVQVRDIQRDRIYVAGLYRTAPKIAAAYARASLKPHDLVLAIRGTWGRIAEVPDELGGANISRDIARLDLTGLTDRSYLATYLRGPLAQDYLKRAARGVAVRGVNIQDVKRTPIMLPPVVEQQRISAEVNRRISILHEVEETIDVNLRRAEHLRQSVLVKAFKGELVQQNPEDELASVVLDRVRIERVQTQRMRRARQS